MLVSFSIVLFYNTVHRLQNITTEKFTCKVIITQYFFVDGPGLTQNFCVELIRVSEFTYYPRAIRMTRLVGRENSTTCSVSPERKII